MITKYFSGLAAIVNIDFHLDHGEIVGLIGPNGAGKTTLFGIISGALVPNSGNIRLKGNNITGLRPDQICKMGVARTFQLVKVFGNMTVLENVLVASLWGNSSISSPHNIENAAMELIQFVGLSGKEGFLCKSLTTADQKLVELARALATKPLVLLLDEVAAGLNRNEVVSFIELIKRILNKGITIFIIEHVMKAITSAADRIIVLHQGRKIAEGVANEITMNETVNKVYLGMDGLC